MKEGLVCLVGDYERVIMRKYDSRVYKFYSISLINL